MLVSMIALLLALLIGGIVYFCKNGIKLPEAPPPQKFKNPKKKGNRTWKQTDKFKTDHRARRAKVYVAPVIQRKWRTPRRSSH